MTQLNTYADKHGRVITAVDHKAGDPLPILDDPIFDVTTDHYMNVMGDGGIAWFIMNRGNGEPLFLAFEFMSNVTLDALDAAQRLKRRFEESDELREQMESYALQCGCAYHEFFKASDNWASPQG